MLLHTARSGVYSVPGGTNLRDSTLTLVKIWDQLRKADEHSHNGNPTLANVAHSSDDYENCLNHWKEIQNVTKPLNYRDSTIVPEGG